MHCKHARYTSKNHVRRHNVLRAQVGSSHSAGGSPSIPCFAPCRPLLRNWMGRRRRRCRSRLGTAVAQADEGVAAAAAAEDSEGNGHANRDCPFHTMHGDLLIQLLVACRSWLPGQAGELVGIIRLLGGGLMGLTARSTGRPRTLSPA
jgi:hypothetical protein